RANDKFALDSPVSSGRGLKSGSPGGKGQGRRQSTEFFPTDLRSFLFNVFSQVPNREIAAAGATRKTRVLRQPHLDIAAFRHIHPRHKYVLSAFHCLLLVVLLLTHDCFIATTWPKSQ